MPSPLSHLFLLRLWKEPRIRNGSMVRVQVRHILSGEVSYYSEWHEAIGYLMGKLDEPVPPDGGRKEKRD